MSKIKFTAIREEQVGDVKLSLEKTVLTNLEKEISIVVRIAKRNVLGQLIVLQKDTITNWGEPDNTPRAVKRYARVDGDFETILSEYRLRQPA